MGVSSAVDADDVYKPEDLNFWNHKNTIDGETVIDT
jgi:hypothetical protein